MMWQYLFWLRNLHANEINCVSVFTPYLIEQTIGWNYSNSHILFEQFWNGVRSPPNKFINDERIFFIRRRLTLTRGLQRTCVSVLLHNSIIKWNMPELKVHIWDFCIIVESPESSRFRKNARWINLWSIAFLHRSSAIRLFSGILRAPIMFRPSPCCFH